MLWQTKSGYPLEGVKTTSQLKRAHHEQVNTTLINLLKVANLALEQDNGIREDDEAMGIGR